MLAAIILLLIKIGIIALVFYVVLWFLEGIGIALPPRVAQILWMICVLIVLYIVVTEMLPAVGGGRFLR